MSRIQADDGFLGDIVQAHRSLTSTLLRLNHGLVDIISKFLSSGKDGRDVDYRSFTRLSDASRAEAVGALGDLYQRLSQSSINLRRPVVHSSDRHGRVLKEAGSNYKHAKKGRTRPEMPRKQSSGKDYPNGALILSKNGSLAEIVPGKSRSSSVSEPAALIVASRRRSPQSPIPSSPPVPAVELPQVQQAQNARRLPTRRDAPRQSFYSFASDSTKLGEIPQHLWAQPWDPHIEEDSTHHWMNTAPIEPDTRREKKGKGLWALFKRNGGVPVAA